MADRRFGELIIPRDFGDALGGEFTPPAVRPQGLRTIAGLVLMAMQEPPITEYVDGIPASFIEYVPPWASDVSVLAHPTADNALESVSLLATEEYMSVVYEERRVVVLEGPGPVQREQRFRLRDEPEVNDARRSIAFTARDFFARVHGRVHGV